MEEEDFNEQLMLDLTDYVGVYTKEEFINANNFVDGELVDIRLNFPVIEVEGLSYTDRFSVIQKFKEHCKLTEWADIIIFVIRLFDKPMGDGYYVHFTVGIFDKYRTEFKVYNKDLVRED